MENANASLIVEGHEWDNWMNNESFRMAQRFTPEDEEEEEEEEEEEKVDSRLNNTTLADDNEEERLLTELVEANKYVEEQQKKEMAAFLEKLELRQAEQKNI